MDIASNYTETLEKTIRDLLERQDDLIRTAFTDELTGLGNRGGFARSLEELWEQDAPVTMAFIDIDNLKHCNDIFGHDEGNRYILQVSLYLKLYMKVDEAAFRLGGDEFAILSTIATEDDLAERLEHCREVLLKNNDSEMPHSFSYGVSHADPALGEASNRMTLDADHRMYDYSCAMPCTLIDAISRKSTPTISKLAIAFSTPFRCSTKAAISLSRTWTNIAPFGHKALCAILAFLRSI